MQNMINRRLVDLCDEKGYTVYRLAAISGLSASTLNSVFKRNNAPTIPTLQKICAAMDITLAQFFSIGFEENTPLQKEYLCEFNRLTSHEKELAVAYIKGMNDSRNDKKKRASKKD